jgi:WD40 repeat protein
MKKIYSVWLLGFAFLLLLGDGRIWTACAQTTEPILRIEVGAHNAGIWDIAIDPSNRILLTGSEDKTVRVWDISGRGELLRVLRPPVGEGEEGHIFTVALSPDRLV